MDIPTRSQLIDQIDAFLGRHDMAESRLGRDAMSDPGVIGRIRSGGNVTLDTLDKLAAYMGERDRLSGGAPEIEGSAAPQAGQLREADSHGPFCVTSSPTHDRREAMTGGSPERICRCSSSVEGGEMRPAA